MIQLRIRLESLDSYSVLASSSAIYPLNSRGVELTIVCGEIGAEHLPWMSNEPRNYMELHFTERNLSADAMCPQVVLRKTLGSKCFIWFSEVRKIQAHNVSSYCAYVSTSIFKIAF